MHNGWRCSKPRAASTGTNAMTSMEVRGGEEIDHDEHGEWWPEEEEEEEERKRIVGIV